MGSTKLEEGIWMKHNQTTSVYLTEVLPNYKHVFEWSTIRLQECIWMKHDHTTRVYFNEALPDYKVSLNKTQ